MPRSAPHFKAHTSIKNHTKMEAVYGDNRLLALWLRLGVEAIERFADRTGDTFIVHDRELPGLVGVGRPDVARTSLRRLADVSPISAERDADVWRITLPNFAKKQGFGPRNGAEMGASSSATSSATATKKKENPSGSCRKRSAPDPPPWATKVASEFAEAIRSGPVDRAKVPRDLRGWAREIDRLHRIDGVPLDEMREVIPWVTRDAFWARNVLSAAKLRKHFPRLLDEKRRGSQRGGEPEYDWRQWVDDEGRPIQ